VENAAFDKDQGIHHYHYCRCIFWLRLSSMYTHQCKQNLAHRKRKHL